MKLTICVDVDGVLNDYKGYDGDNLGKPKPGAKEFLQELNKNYKVVILSARRYTQIMKWLNDYGLWEYISNVTSFKPPALAYIDDRGIQFNGNYQETLKQLKGFKPYWSE